MSRLEIGPGEGGLTAPPDVVAPGELARLARAGGKLAVDTEFMGEGRYRTLLCLVQVAVRGDRGGVVSVIDALDDGLDPQPLADVLADPAVEVLMHAGRQDVALLRRMWRTEVRSIFDTQVAAGFAGLRAQASYESVLASVLGRRLNKTASYTRWDIRPLTPEQVAYARADVIDLLDLGEELQRRLDSRGRLSWAREECRALESVSDVREPDQVFARLPRVGSLDPRTRAVARELVDWREVTARDGDRPVNSVLNDTALVEVARRRPASPSALQALRGLPAATLRRRAPGLLAAVERGCERPPLTADRGRRPVVLEEDAPLVALAEALARARAAEEGLAYELLATRAELQAMVAWVRETGEEPGVRALAGWRRELVGRQLIDLLTGAATISVGEDRRVIIVAPVNRDGGGAPNPSPDGQT